MANLSGACPVCSSSDVRRTGDATYRCNVCDTLYELKGAESVVLSAGVPPTSSPTSASPVPGWLAAVVLIVAVAVGAGVGLLLRSDTSPPAPEASVPRQKPMLPPEPEGVGEKRAQAGQRRNLPDIEIAHTMRGTNREGRPFWLVTYRNLDRFPLSQPAIRATLFGADGAFVASHVGRAPLERLDPNQEVVILVEVPAEPAFERAEVLAEVPEPLSQELPVVELLVDQIKVAGDRMTGRIRNPTGRPALLRNVVAVGRDGDRQPVAWVYGNPNVRIVPPNGEATFEGDAREYLIEFPDQWTGLAFATVAP